MTREYRKGQPDYHLGIQVSVRSSNLTRAVVDAAGQAAVAAGYTGISEVTAELWRQIASGQLILPRKPVLVR